MNQTTFKKVTIRPALRAAAEAFTPARDLSKRKARSAWGRGGTRYDEACGICGRITEVDNMTGLCRTCGQ